MPHDADLCCPACNRLLAKRRADGAFEVRLGKRFHAVIRDGEITCISCNKAVPCRVEAPAARLTFGRGRRRR